MALFSKKNQDTKSEEKEEKKASVAKDSTQKKVREEEKEASMKDLYSETKKKSSSKKDKKDSKKDKIAYRVLVKPLVTEKAANLSESNQYVFEVSKSANKIDVAKAIFEVYNVKPVSVNIVNNKGKKVTRGRQVGYRKDWKKAIVSLPKGKTLNIYEGV